MERVLVTGCGGFVGGVIAGALHREGFISCGVDRRDGGAFVGNNFRSCDLKDPAEVESVIAWARPDHIVHLAAQSSAGKSFEQPSETIQDNVLPILHILECLRGSASGVRLLAVGSADVYGPVPKADLPLTELQPPNPTNPYALSKTIQEQCCVHYAELYRVDVVMTRSFNHTGAGQRDTFVLSSFAKQLAEIKRGDRAPVIEVGNLDLKRDFSDVQDVVNAYIALLKKGKGGEIYNVCSGVSYGLRSLLENLCDLSGVEVEIRVDAKRLRPVDMEELRGDHTKLTKATGWKPGIDIKETLGGLFEYWMKNIDN